MNTPAVRAYAAIIIATLVWGGSFVVLKFAVGLMHPMLVVFFRMLIGALGFIALWPWLRQGLNYQPGDWKYLLGLALFEPCLYFIFEGWALSYTSAGQAGMVTSMLPMMVAVAAFFILKEKTYLRQWLGFALAIIGVAVMTFAATDSEQAPNPLLGNFLEFCAMASAVGYTLLVKHLVSRYSAFFITAVQSFVGTIFFFPIALTVEWPATIELELVWALLYLGLFVSLFGYGLFNYSMTHLKATVSVGFTNLLPAYSLLFSMIFLGEKINQWQWLAIGLIFFAVYLGWERKSAASEAPPAVN